MQYGIELNISAALATSYNLSFSPLQRKSGYLCAPNTVLAGPIHIYYSSAVWKVEEFIARVGPQKF
jgi:hypothetical protein